MAVLDPICPGRTSDKGINNNLIGSKIPRNKYRPNFCIGAATSTGLLTILYLFCDIKLSNPLFGLSIKKKIDYR